MAATPARYDAILLQSFGAPHRPEDVVPFLENVTRGRGVPRERLEVVATQYEASGGRSPLGDQNRELLGALQAELESRGRDVPLFWGCRNWAPYIEDTVQSLADMGAQRVLAVTTSAFSSYSGCRQYHEDIARARAAVHGTAPVIDKVRPYFNIAGFVQANRDRVQDALDQLGDGAPARLVFTAHSIPQSMASTSDYEVQLRDVAESVASATTGHDGEWDLVYQSRSGPPQVPWLEPDIGDHLRTLAADGTTRVVVSPIGFTSDHQEVVFDLDTEAAAIAEEVGIEMVRAGTVGTHPAFVSSLADLIDEHLVGGLVRHVGRLGPRVWPCAPGCCPAPQRPPGRPGGPPSGGRPRSDGASGRPDPGAGAGPTRPAPR